MRTFQRNKVWPIFGVAFSAALNNAQSQVAPWQPSPLPAVNPTVVTPSIPSVPMSESTRQKVSNWMKAAQKPSQSARGPSTDPDYSEFWIEMHRADANWIPESEFSPNLIRPGKGGSGENIKVNLLPYLLHKSVKGGAPLANWNEDVWTEIAGPGPDGFAEMFPGGDDSRKNSTLSIFASEKGKPVPSAYYSEILRTLMESSVKGR